MERLTREEAAKELMVSQITVDKFVTQNLLEPVSFEADTQKPVFDKEQVAALKELRAQDRMKAFQELRQLDAEFDESFED